MVFPEGSFVQSLSSYPKQRDVHLTQVVCDNIELSLEVKEQPGHSVHCDIGHHSEGIPTQEAQKVFKQAGRGDLK